MRLPDNELETKRVRIQIREIDVAGKYKSGAKSENFIVLECTPQELKAVIVKAIALNT
jgi:hypothetical protein